MKNTTFSLNFYQNPNNSESTNIISILKNSSLAIKYPIADSQNIFSNQSTFFEEKFDSISEISEDGLGSFQVEKLLNDTFKLIKKGETNISNCVFTLGPKRSGKSTLLRGNEYKEGIILKTINKLYKLVLSFVNSKDDIILIKHGCFGQQEEKSFNLTKPKIKKSYFDEIIINNEERKNEFHINHIGTFEELEREMEYSIFKRSDFIDLDKNHNIIYHFTMTVKRNDFSEQKKYSSLKNILYIQIDFFELNINNTNDVLSLKPYLENIILRKKFIEKDYSLERVLFRNIDKYSFSHFMFTINNYYLFTDRDFMSDEIKELFNYIKVINYFKTICNRKDLLNTQERMNISEICENCFKTNIELEETNKFQNKTLSEIITLGDELDQIYSKLKQLNDMKQGQKIPLDKSAARNVQANIDMISKKINTDSVKLEKLISNLNSVFQRTQLNISSLKNVCVNCKDKPPAKNTLINNKKNNSIPKKNSKNKK
jgi:hypothetical protein